MIEDERKKKGNFSVNIHTRWLLIPLFPDRIGILNFFLWREENIGIFIEQGREPTTK